MTTPLQVLVLAALLELVDGLVENVVMVERVKGVAYGTPRAVVLGAVTVM